MVKIGRQKNRPNTLVSPAPVGWRTLAEKVYCCLARMLPGEAENGVGMNRSVREGKKCEAL